MSAVFNKHYFHAGCVTGRALDIMSAVLCSNKRISGDVLNAYNCDAWSLVIIAAFTVCASLVIKYACNSVIICACLADILYMILNAKVKVRI